MSGVLIIFCGVSTMHENDPKVRRPTFSFIRSRLTKIQVLEREKSRNLSKTQPKSSIYEDAPGWNETLASASEAAVKVNRPFINFVFRRISNRRSKQADRSSRKVDELVNKTVQFRRLRDEAEAEETASTTAPYRRDEVHGPLKGVGKEEVVIERDTVVVDDGVNRVQEIREVKKTLSKENGTL